MLTVDKAVNNKGIPTFLSKKKAFFLVFLLLGLYLIDMTPLSVIFKGILYNGLIKPSLWLGLFFMIKLSPQIRPHSKLRSRKIIYSWAFTFAIIHLVALAIGGLINGFGNSPYSQSMISLLTNVFMFGSIILGREAARAYIVNTLAQKENYIFFTAFALFTAFISLPINNYTGFKDISEAVQFLARRFVPAFAGNFLANYFVFIGGVWSSVIYYGVIEGVTLLSPILPNLEWLAEALICILTPFFSCLFMQKIYIKASNIKLQAKDRRSNEDLFGWLAVSLFSIGLIWFILGVFPMYPSVIATGSMEPLINPGDVIITKKITFDQVQTGDIVQFKSGSILISHRVIEKIDTDEENALITKGDNNSSADSDKVKPEDIKGKIIHIIPKIGWPTLWLKSENDQH